MLQSRDTSPLAFSSSMQDYEVVDWVAEPVNTVSCLVMIILPLLFLSMHEAHGINNIHRLHKPESKLLKGAYVGDCVGKYYKGSTGLLGV